MTSQDIPSTHHKLFPSHYIICHLPLVFLSPTSPLPFYSPSLFRSPLFRLLVIMASPLSSPLSPENEVLNFKQREGENLKDAWYRICNAQNRSTRKQSTSVLLRNFYVGASPCYRYILDTIIRGNFLGCHTFDSYNAMLDLFGPPPLLVNGTVLTLDHVMQRLEIIENKVATIELIVKLDKSRLRHSLVVGRG